jgi:hypothetical protein
MREDKPKGEQPLSGIDEAKRRTLTRLALGTAFVTPIIVSFPMDGLTISRVHAATADGSGFVRKSGGGKKKSDGGKKNKKHFMHPNGTQMSPPMSPNST